ncbi:hypothetical protein ACFQMM_03595 [Saliphagus sp. GCM10025308]
MVIRDEDVFDEDWVPGDIKHRTQELITFSNALAPAIGGVVDNVVTIYGPPGVGKTVSSMYALEQLKMSDEDVVTVMVNCWVNYKPFEVLEKILRTFVNTPAGTPRTNPRSHRRSRQARRGRARRGRSPGR